MTDNASKRDDNDPLTWDWGDKPLTDDEKRMIPLRNHDNAVVANAFDHMIENEVTVVEYLEYLEDMAANDFRKYYGWANLQEARQVLLLGITGTQPS